VYLKSIGDCIRSRDESIDTHLDPPLFWLDNIFKEPRNLFQGISLRRNFGRIFPEKAEKTLEMFCLLYVLFLKTLKNESYINFDIDIVSIFVPVL
jgi:hypothetical protein